MNTNNYTENTNTYKVEFYCSLGISKINACERYGSSHEAKLKGNKIIDDAYELATGYLMTGTENCLAVKIAKRYGEFVRKKYYNPDNGEEVSDLVENAEDNLKELFEAELKENPAIYQMYDKSFYADVFSVAENDFSVKTGNVFWDTLGEIIGIDLDYTLDNILEAIIGMETDINKLAEIFFKNAYEIYLEYCRKIENLRV